MLVYLVPLTLYYGPCLKISLYGTQKSLAKCGAS
jgi:hypothetical protein